MKKLLFLIALLYGPKVYAQNYLITFAGTGESTTVSNVKVENFTKGTSRTVNGSDILRLTVVTGVNSIRDIQSSELKIYPNPMDDNSTLQIYPPEAGNAVISVIDITGKQLANTQIYLENQRQDFRLSGLENGFYVINVKGNNYQFSGKLLSTASSRGTISIEKLNNINQAVDEKAVKTDSKGTQATVDMEYSTGDRIKFTGISGNYSTVIIDIPASDKTITFNFIACTDADNNNYPVVKIGSQVWMAENLKTTKYNNNAVIPLVAESSAWEALRTPGYCWFNNDSTTYKDAFGAIYNWFVGNSEINHGKNVCPIGWHVPTESQWDTLTSYLGKNGYGSIVKSMAATSGWHTSSVAGSPGNDQISNNSSGFTALPVGYRGWDGGFGPTGSFSSSTWWSSTEVTDGMGRVCGLASNLRDLNRDDFAQGKTYGFSIRCLLGDLVRPILTTSAVSIITQTSATCGGIVTGDGGTPVTTRGVCWNTSPNPTTANNKTFDSTGTGTFISSITGLSASTSYYVRAYATNSFGTTYGNEISFCTDVTDIDGNQYNTVTIGTQVWMAENLKTSKYRNGELIGSTTPSTLNIGSESTPKYQWAWEGNENNVAAYGRLYTWYVVDDNRNICPIGWHVPSDDEWTTLTDFLGGLSLSGGKLKEAGYTHWLSPNTGATNETGFTALPGGYRFSSGAFGGIGSDGLWWSSTGGNINDALTRGMGNSYSGAYRTNNNKRSGYSVRCIKGELVLPTITSITVSSISLTTATTGGDVKSNGDAPVTVRGVCWSTTANPTITDYKTIDGAGTGSYTSAITGLTTGTTYYVRAYATNSFGTNYGNQFSFNTKISDVEGNSYNIVRIGTQVWMTENLKTSKYNDGSDIPLVTVNWANRTTPGYCWYNNVATYKDTYGALYNWYTVSTGKLCPAGWHVPNSPEWHVLRDNSGVPAAGGKHKATGTIEDGDGLWYFPNFGATNESGFTAIPAGARFYLNGSFYGIGENSFFWTSDDENLQNLGLYVGFGYSNASFLWTGRDKPQGMSVRCLRNEDNQLPTVNTKEATAITPATAIGGGHVTSAGEGAVISHGVCWSTAPMPAISDSKTNDGSGTGSFSSLLTGLSANTVYYVRAYSTNIAGTSYGSQVSFKTIEQPGPIIFNPDLAYGSLSDIDGNNYKTIQIGSQTWMAENLKTTRYKNGTDIPLVTGFSAWYSLVTPGYCWYNDDPPTNKDTYGALYNWYTVSNNQGLCPPGWHIPTDIEWTNLTTYLGGASFAGDKMKESGTTHWSDGSAGDNSSGFTALPAGGLTGGGYMDIGNSVAWWSSTTSGSSAFNRAISYESGIVYVNTCLKHYGLSVRCLKDN